MCMENGRNTISATVSATRLLAAEICHRIAATFGPLGGQEDDGSDVGKNERKDLKKYVCMYIVTSYVGAYGSCGGIE